VEKTKLRFKASLKRVANIRGLRRDARINPGLMGDKSPRVGEIHLLANSKVPDFISKDFERLMVTPKLVIRSRYAPATLSSAMIISSPRRA
jgi:hypothetical protein